MDVATVAKERNYSAVPEDIAWASKGLTTRIRNGVIVPTF